MIDAPRRKILFFAEAVTLAHVSRPVILARALDPSRYEITLAMAPRYQSLWSDLPARVRPIESISVAQFLGALAKGQPLYDASTLRRYVAEDLEVIREVGPDVIVGDFRLSLSVSARVAGVPYLTITNAYWSPYARQRFPLPELPMVQWLSLPIARAVFGMARPLAFAMHTRPLNRVRREHGLPSLGFDLRRVYTDADLTLYADIPELAPTFDLPPSHRYLGPIVWSPAIGTPPWWNERANARPIVYVTMGSSGSVDLLSRVLDALADLPVDVIAATLGQPLPRPIPPNARTADYLPGREAASRAALVICNGGSPTTHQALAEGVPVLGVASNMDQHLNMAGIAQCGAGLLIRSDRASLDALRTSAALMLDHPAYSAAARSLAGLFSRASAAERFRSIIEERAGDR